MDSPEIVTLVIHHPDRPLLCLEACLASLSVATKRSHLITLFVQGPIGSLGELHLADLGIDNTTDVVFLGEHMGPVLPRVLSVQVALKEKAQWWAKLDDDGEVHAGTWDLLIESIQDAGEEIGCAMANPNHNASPKELVTVGGAVVLEESAGGREGGDGERIKWRECGFVGDGATVFRTEMFEDGIRYDPEFIRGADIDLAMQAQMYGYRALMCDPPHSIHNHHECTTKKYERVRYDAEEVWKAARRFREKWGMDCPHLSQFGPRKGQ